LDICFDLSGAAKGNNNNIPYGYACDIIKKLKPSYKWLKRGIVNKSFRKYHQHAKEKNNNQCLDSGLVSKATVEAFPLCESVFSDITNGSEFSSLLLDGMLPQKKSKGGRPMGSTLAAKKEEKKKLMEVKNEIAVRYTKMKKESKKKRKKEH